MNRTSSGRFAKGHNIRVGLNHSDEAKERMRIAKLGTKQTQEHIAKKTYHEEKHPMWKGDDVGYNALHSWVRRKLGLPKKCSNCGFETENSFQLHWANLSHQYKRDVSDWVRLCASCHKNYDLNKITICV